MCAGARKCVCASPLARPCGGAVAGVCGAVLLCCWWCGPWSGRSGLARSVSVGWRILSALRGTRCGCMTLRRRRRADSEPIAQQASVSQIGGRRGRGCGVSGSCCSTITSSSSVAASLLIARYWSMCSAAD